jgi:hypothetical protein
MTPTQRTALAQTAVAIERLSDAATDASTVGKINWTNLRKMFADILKTLIPIVLPLIIGLLDPPQEEPK